jgi:amidophosphoribosyltransferase
MDMLFDDKPKEECGLFGIFAPEQEVAQHTYYVDSMPFSTGEQWRVQEDRGIRLVAGYQHHKGWGWL